jgi:hypothetical protein
MHNNFVKQFALAIALAGIACAAQAHRPWMLPTSTFIETDREAWVTIDGAVSEGLFDVDHMPLRMDGLLVTDPDGITAPAPAATVGKFRSSVDLQAAEERHLPHHPGRGERHGQLQTEWRDEALPRHRADRRQGDPAWRHRGQAHHHGPAPGHLRHRQQADHRRLKPLGSGLELVPVTHPNELRAGEKATFRFQLDGKPLPNFPFSLIPGGVKYRGTLNEVRLTPTPKAKRPSRCRRRTCTG